MFVSKCLSEWVTDFTDVTLVSKNTFWSGDEDKDDKRKKFNLISDKSYLVIKSKKGKTVKEVKVCDTCDTCACGDVFPFFIIFTVRKVFLVRSSDSELLAVICSHTSVAISDIEKWATVEPPNNSTHWLNSLFFLQNLVPI